MFRFRDWESLYITLFCVQIHYSINQRNFIIFSLSFSLSLSVFAYLLFPLFFTLLQTCASLLHPKVVEILMTLMLKGVLHFYSQGSSCIEFKNLFSASNSFSFFYIIQVFIFFLFRLTALSDHS